MKAKRAQGTKMITALAVTLGLVIALIFIFGDIGSRLAPVLGKLGLIDTSKAAEKEEQKKLAEERQIPEDIKRELGNAIASISSSMHTCKNVPSAPAPCTCDLSIPDFPTGYIIRIRDTSDGSFMAAYKAGKGNDADVPVSEQLGASSLPIDPCFSSTLDTLSGNLVMVQNNPQQAIGSLSSVYEPFINLARENDQLWAVIPEKFTDEKSCVWSDDDMQYRVLGASENAIKNNNFKLIRFADNSICFIVDRQEDKDRCYAGVRKSTAQKYINTVSYFPSCSS